MANISHEPFRVVLIRCPEQDSKVIREILEPHCEITTSMTFIMLKEKEKYDAFVCFGPESPKQFQLNLLQYESLPQHIAYVFGEGFVRVPIPLNRTDPPNSHNHFEFFESVTSLAKTVLRNLKNKSCSDQLSLPLEVKDKISYSV